MTAALANLTPEERTERVAFLKRLGLGPKGDAKVVPIGNPVRKPLGLGITPGDDKDDTNAADPEKGFPGFRFRDDAHGARPEDALRSDWLFHYFDIIGGVMIELTNDTVHEINDLQDHLKRKFDGIEAARRAENAELRAVIAELRGEVRELKALQESARVASRGERGLDGPRGIAGPPGGQGRAGPRGAKGEIGAKPAAWVPDVEAFSITPIYPDNSRGVPANLRSLFERYDAQTRGDEDDA